MQLTNSVAVRLMSWVMALSPVSLAVLCHTGLRSQPLSITVPTQPSLSFNQYAVDLRTIPPTAIVEAKFLFQNRGNQPVQITKIEPSCACLTPKLYGARDNTIEAGGQGQVILRMQPANTTPGPHDYTVKVSYTDPEPREAQLLLRMVIPATIWVNPPVLFVFHPVDNLDVTEKEFVVSDGRGRRFDIIDVSVDTDLVETAIGESGRSPTGNYQQSVHVKFATKLPPGRKTHVLRIMTDDPDVPELRVPLMIEGGADGEAEPALDHE